MLATGVVVPFAFGQAQTRADLAERFRQMSEEYEAEGLAAPFQGNHDDGTVMPGLFEIAPPAFQPSRSETRPRNSSRR